MEEGITTLVWAELIPLRSRNPLNRLLLLQGQRSDESRGTKVGSLMEEGMVQCYGLCTITV